MHVQVTRKHRLRCRVEYFLATRYTAPTKGVMICSCSVYFFFGSTKMRVSFLNLPQFHAIDVQNTAWFCLGDFSWLLGLFSLTRNITRPCQNKPSQPKLPPNRHRLRMLYEFSSRRTNNASKHTHETGKKTSTNLNRHNIAQIAVSPFPAPPRDKKKRLHLAAPHHNQPDNSLHWTKLSDCRWPASETRRRNLVLARSTASLLSCAESFEPPAPSTFPSLFVLYCPVVSLQHTHPIPIPWAS